MISSISTRLRFIKQHIADTLRWSNIKSRSKWLFRNSDPTPMELASGISSVFWALVLWAPGSTFSRSSYQNLSLITNEDRWGLIFFVVGAFQLYAVFSSVKIPHLLQQVICATAAFVWIYVSVAFLLIYPLSTGIAPYLVFACGSLWAFLRTGPIK